MSSVRARLFAAHIADMQDSLWQPLDVDAAMRRAELDEPHAHAIAREAGIRVGRLLDAVEAIPVREWGRSRWRRIAAWLAEERRDPLFPEARVLRGFLSPPRLESDMTIFTKVGEFAEYAVTPLTKPAAEGGVPVPLDGAAVAAFGDELASYFSVEPTSEDGLSGKVTLTSLPEFPVSGSLAVKGDADRDAGEVRELFWTALVTINPPAAEATVLEGTLGDAQAPVA